MKKIPLGNDKFTLIDKEDYKRLKGFNWRFEKSVNGSSGYAVATIKMHRLITKAKRGEEIDHINHDKMDNRRENLRKATHSQNCQNRPPDIKNKSGYRGVHWFKAGNKWAARIGVNGKRIFLGYFDNKEGAAKAYNKAARLEYGEFAYQNQILA